MEPESEHESDMEPESESDMEPESESESESDNENFVLARREREPEPDIEDLVVAPAIADNDDVEIHSCRDLFRGLITDASSVVILLTISDRPPNIPPFLLSPPSSIQTLRQRSYRYSLSARTQTLTLVASSLGFLIFLAADHAVIASPFFGVEQPSPTFPLRLRQPLQGILTSSPLTDDSCTLVITAASCTLFWRLAGENSWVRVNQLTLGKEISAFTMVDGLLYCLTVPNYGVNVVCFEDPAAGVSCTNLNLQPLPQPPAKWKRIRHRILECGGEILLALIFSPGRREYRIDVYRLDLARKMWVKKESLGDWCLFLDIASNSALACLKPFGVRNCIYVAGPGCERWCLLRYGLDFYANAENRVLDMLCKAVKADGVWPSPVWIEYGFNQVIQILRE